MLLGGSSLYGSWSRPQRGRDHEQGGLSCPAREVVRREGAGVAQVCVRRSVVERAGEANSHLVTGDSRRAITFLPGFRCAAAGRR
ncbi:MAG: hypothetical protein QOH56_1903 [Pseudonocardiales bacterium]|nr:hypothetical protein [Pseudonocardiales bacterium]